MKFASQSALALLLLRYMKDEEKSQKWKNKDVKNVQKHFSIGELYSMEGLVKRNKRKYYIQEWREFLV